MLAGSSRESASRFLATLERAGVISQGRGRLVGPRSRRAAQLCLLSWRRPTAGWSLRGDELLVITPAGKRVTGLPKGGMEAGETPEQVAAREVREETGVVANVLEPLGDVRYTYRRGGRRVRKTVHFFLCEYVDGLHRRPRSRGRRRPLDRARERPRAAQLPGRAGADRAPAVQDAVRSLVCRSVQVLNFYSTVFADQMKRGRKTATIRLGDKRHKYRKNQVVLVTVGYQYSPREKLFHAVIDNVEVKRVKDLSPRDIEHDNPEFRRTEELVHFLKQIYDREVALDDTVTVVRFSQIVENPPDFQDRLRGVGGAQN